MRRKFESGWLAAPAALLLLACGASDPAHESLVRGVDSVITESGAEVGVYFRMVDGSDSLTVNPDLRMHAASTMKVPVMIQLFRDSDDGTFSITDSIEVKNTFSSIVDGSPFEMLGDVDSDQDIYELVGLRIPVENLIHRMITMSSNLATNILIEFADAERVTATMRTLGADSIEVLRGVEDLVAFEAGLSNTTTARDLGVIFTALANGTAAGEASTEAMLEILSEQHFANKIPAGLPEGTHVANKTGNITRISHDAGIIYPEGGDPYVLAVLVRGIDDADESAALIAEISRLVFEHVVGEQDG